MTRTPRSVQRFASFAKTYLRASASTGYLFLIGFVSPRNRVLFHVLSDHFAAQRKKTQAAYYAYSRRLRTLLPRIDVGALLPQELTIHLQEVQPVDGTVALDELVILAGLVQCRRPRRIFEIGTFDGATARNLALNCPEGSTVYTLDLPPDGAGTAALPLDPGDRQFMGRTRTWTGLPPAPRRAEIVQLYGDSARFDYSPFCGSIDLVFVDGAHSYDYAMNDSMRALRLLRQGGGGVIVWHDYGVWPGVTQALEELSAHRHEFAAMKHVDGTSLALLDVR